MLHTDYSSKAECDNHTERDFCSHVALDTFNEICIYAALRHDSDFFSLRERTSFAQCQKISFFLRGTQKFFISIAPLCWINIIFIKRSISLNENSILDVKRCPFVIAWIFDRWSWGDFYYLGFISAFFKILVSILSPSYLVRRRWLIHPSIETCKRKSQKQSYLRLVDIDRDVIYKYIVLFSVPLTSFMRNTTASFS